jgi:hypothetical protein
MQVMSKRYSKLLQQLLHLFHQSLSILWIFPKRCAPNFLLLFEHDAHNELASLRSTEKGVRIDQTFDFNSFFS